MNAKQLKDSILQYAFQGKLIDAIDVSESAIKLVEMIMDEKNQLIKEKVIKKVKVSSIEEADYLWDIPEHWVWERAANVLDVRDGTHDTPKYVSEGIPLVTSKNLKNGEISFENAKFISLDDHLAIEQRSKVDSDDILFAMIGTIGNPVLVKKDRDFSVKNVGIFKSYPVNKLNMKYVYYYLIYMENILKKNASGGVQAFISLSGLRDIMIPIAPLKEQNDIVLKIEELMKKANLYEDLHTQLESHNKNFPTNLEKSILQYAMQGKLVEQDPNDEPAQMLVEKIRVEKERLVKEKVIKKEKSLPPIMEEEIPFDIPSSWEWVRLGDITNVTSVITPLKSNVEYYQNGTIPWCTSTVTGLEIVNEPTDFITEKALKECSLSIYPKGTLIMAMYGQGKTRGQVTEINFDSAINQACAAIEIINKDLIQKSYLRLCLSYVYNSIREKSAGGAQPNLNLFKVKSILIPVPPLKEQHRIVQAIEKMMVVKDKLM